MRVDLLNTPHEKKTEESQVIKLKKQAVEIINSTLDGNNRSSERKLMWNVPEIVVKLAGNDQEYEIDISGVSNGAITNQDRKITYCDHVIIGITHIGGKRGERVEYYLSENPYIVDYRYPEEKRNIKPLHINVLEKALDVAKYELSNNDQKAKANQAPKN